MTMKIYQVTIDENGDAESVILLPEETPKKRTLIVRETSEHRAKTRAETLFSLVSPAK